MALKGCLGPGGAVRGGGPPGRGGAAGGRPAGAEHCLMDSPMRLRSASTLMHLDLHAVADLDHLGRILDEAVGQLADVDQAVLVHADVHEGAEGGHVGDDRP